VQSATLKHDLPAPSVAVRNLMEQGRFAHLGTIMSRMHHRRAGYPFGSLVDYTVDATGHPLLALSPLAIHTRNVLSDSRCNLVVQMPGWSGLANARVTVFGDLEQLEGEEAATAAEALRFKHAPGGREVKSLSAQNFLHFRMSRICDVFFVGGFGTMQWIDVGEYVSAQPDAIVTRTASGSPEATLAALNSEFGAQLPRFFSAASDEAGPGEEAQLVSIDAGGVDVRVRRAGGVVAMERLRFPRAVESLEQARGAMGDMLAQQGG